MMNKELDLPDLDINSLEDAQEWSRRKNEFPSDHTITQCQLVCRERQLGDARAQLAERDAAIRQLGTAAAESMYRELGLSDKVTNLTAQVEDLERGRKLDYAVANKELSRALKSDAELAALQSDENDRESREAEVLPEDVGTVDFIKQLQRELAALREGAWPQEMPAALRQILGLTCLTFIHPANAYRKAGFDIKTRAEEEQAFFLHRLIGFWFKHGDKWNEVANAELKEIRDRIIDATGGGRNEVVS